MLSEEIVTVLVGEVPKRYCLHKKLLCHHSTFFAAAFDGDFQEGTSSQLRLPEEEAGAFDIFVHGLYTGSLPRTWYGVHVAKPSSCVSVYAMGEKWFIPRLQDDISCELRKRFDGNECPPCSLFNKLYEATRPECKLRQYFVKKFVSCALDKGNLDISNSILEQNGEFAIDVAKETILKLGTLRALASSHAKLETFLRASSIFDAQKRFVYGV